MAAPDLLMIGLGVDTRRLRDGERALGRLQQVGNRTESALGRMASMLAVAFSASKIIEYADAYTNLQNRLKLVTDSTVSLAQATQNVVDIARNSRQELGATGDLYFKISQNADALGLSVADVTRVTETFGKTLALSGAGTQQAEAAILQFSQALASGVFRGDEFNSVAENAPAAMEAFARALQVPKGELRKLAHEGMLTADILIQALKEQSLAVETAFNKTESTISQGFVGLKNSAIVFVGQMNEATGISKEFVSILSKMSGALDESNVKESADSITTALHYAYVAGQLYVGLKFSQFVSGMATATAATLKEVIAQQALRNATLAETQAQLQAAIATARRTQGELALDMVLLDRARTTATATLASHNLLVADLELARMNAALAAGTSNAAAANIALAMATDAVALSQRAVIATSTAESAAIARATTASAANTTATLAQTAAQEALAIAQTQAAATSRIATGVLAGLGGTIGAITLALGLAATAWFVFGDNAEKAGNKAEDAIAKAKNKVSSLADDDLQALTDRLSTVQSLIDDTMNNIRSSSMSSNESIKTTLDNELSRLLKQKQELQSTIDAVIFDRTTTDLLNNPQVEQGGAKSLLDAQKAKIENDKLAKKAAEDAKNAAKSLQSNYESIALGQKERIDLWGQETELAKINFALKNTELSKLLPQEKELLRVQAQKIDALQAEKDLSAQQKEVDSFMAGEAQQLDELRAQYATENEIIAAGYRARQAIIDEALAREKISKDEARVLSKKNERQVIDEKRQLEVQKLGVLSQGFGNIATLMQSENRKLFEIGKAAALAQAFVNTATAITNALAVQPYPLGLALAATAGVAGAVQIAAIQNQQISGARAMGGDVQGGKSYLVGERGAEVITMGGNGHVTPNHKLGGGDSKITIVNQTTGRIDNVEEKTMPDGERILIIQQARDLIASEMRDPNSKTSRSMQSSLTVQRRR